MVEADRAGGTVETRVWSRSRLMSVSNAEHASQACRDHGLRARRETSQDQPM